LSKLGSIEGGSGWGKSGNVGRGILNLGRPSGIFSVPALPNKNNTPALNPAMLAMIQGRPVNYQLSWRSSVTPEHHDAGSLPYKPYAC